VPDETDDVGVGIRRRQKLALDISAAEQRQFVPLQVCESFFTFRCFLL